MKRLGMVLLGLMFWSVNTLAQEDCGTPPRVLAPGKHSVLLFDQPFVVQWQDDDQCLGDTVKIEITQMGPGEFSSQVLASETENKGRYEVWGDQLDEVRRADASRKNAQYIVITNAYDDSISIESKVFLIKPNRLENTFSEQEMYHDKMEDIAIRDLLIRLTAMERQTGYVEDDNEAWDTSDDADLKGGPVRRARKKASKRSKQWQSKIQFSGCEPLMGTCPQQSHTPAGTKWGNARKYSELVQRFNCPADQAGYGEYTDYGYSEGGFHCGQEGKPGYWVWVKPTWFVWEQKRNQAEIQQEESQSTEEPGGKVGEAIENSDTQVHEDRTVLLRPPQAGSPL